MLELLRLAVALVGSAVGGYWDLRTTDVPDTLLFGMIGAGLFLNFLEWQLFGLQELFFSSLLYTAVFGLFAVMMYKSGAWGGGDGAMLAAIGSLLPAWIFPSSFSWLPFPMVYMIAVFMVGLVWSVGYILFTVFRNTGLTGQLMKGMMDRKLIFLGFAAAAAASLLFTDAPLSFLLSFLLLLMVPLMVMSKVSEKAFSMQVPSSKIRPGDMLGEDIPKLKLWKRELRGLKESEIAKIRKARRTVLIRTGVRYTPVFFFALLLLMLI